MAPEAQNPGMITSSRQSPVVKDSIMELGKSSRPDASTRSSAGRIRQYSRIIRSLHTTTLPTEILDTVSLVLPLSSDRTLLTVDSYPSVAGPLNHFGVHGHESRGREQS